MSFRKASQLASLLLVLTASACDKTQPGASQPVAQPAQPAQPKAAAEPTPVVSTDERDARALLDSWREAQNNGDFATYEQLYAARSYGEKRAGSRLSKYDRAGWLADRKRMFERPMQVVTEDVQIKTSAGSTLLSFAQTFSQASFQDRGPKRMTLVRENGQLRIASELMLASTLTASSPEAAEDFFFVVKVQGKSYAVLKAAAPRSWGVGEPDAPFVTNDGTYVVLQEVGALPEAEAVLRARPLRVFSQQGTSCDTKLGTMKLMAAVVPHFGTAQLFRGEREGEHLTPWPAAKIAASILHDVWDDDLALVSELAGCEGDFATSPARKVKVLVKQEVDAATSAAATAAVAKLPLFKRAQTEYDKERRADKELPPGAWPESSEVAQFGSGDGRVISVRHKRGEGCGDYTDSLTQLLHVGTKLTPLAGARPAEAPSLLIDLDSDGVLSLLNGSGEFSRTLTRITGSTSNVLERVPFSFQDCGC